MARGLFRQHSMAKIIAAYRSQYKRFWMRLLTFGLYGSKGIGWWRDPERALYNRRYHRSSISLMRMLGYRPSRFVFCVYMLIVGVSCAVTTPVDIASAATTAHKIKKQRKERAASGESYERPQKAETTPRHSTTASTSHTANTTSITKTTSSTGMPAPKSELREQHSVMPEKKAQPQATQPISQPTQPTATVTVPTSPKPTPPVSQPKAIAYVKPIQTEEKATPIYAPTPAKIDAESFKPITPLYQPKEEPDENTPKSTPKNEKDQYIRKRLIIAGASYCDQDVLDKLTVGSYLDLVAEPDNPYDKGAVMLTHEGEKVGYVAKADRAPYAACLRLGRPVYGVVTDIVYEANTMKYEFETWFGQKDI